MYVWLDEMKRIFHTPTFLIINSFGKAFQMNNPKSDSNEYDVNGLNKDSVQWAKYYYCINGIFYFLVNNSEVKRYKKVYDYIILYNYFFVHSN